MDDGGMKRMCVDDGWMIVCADDEGYMWVMDGYIDD